MARIKINLARAIRSLGASATAGTTLMAAERVGRICYGREIDPLYVNVANLLLACASARTREIAAAGW